MSEQFTVYVAKAIHTMERGFPTGEAVAVRDGRIVAVGSLDQVRSALGDRPYAIDETFKDDVVLPGLIDQHLHPLLGASTLMTEVIATEDWVLPDRTFPAADGEDDYRAKLAAAEQRTRGSADEANNWMFSWGYHELWHGEMSREYLDTLSADRPLAVWQRSCHEFYLNSRAMEILGVDQAWLDGIINDPNSSTTALAATKQLDLELGHFFEGAVMGLLLGKIAPFLFGEERMRAGLKQLVGYLHQNGVTAINEPGIFWDSEPFALYEELLGGDDVPFLTSFLVEAQSQANTGVPRDKVIAESEAAIARADGSPLRLFGKQVKFFADGAIISQQMQMRAPYLDTDGNPDPSHTGNWMTDPTAFAQYYRTYWDAGWQIHTHVNGDKGLDMVLDTLETCMTENPRAGHRHVIVHMANSTEDQIDRIARLGAIVSANPYYPVGFAEKYSAYGLGPARAEAMVRAKSVVDRGNPLSFHSDLPMAVSAPLVLAGYGEERRTPSGKVVAPEQRISRWDALAAVTINAAYSWQREDDLGSIAPGKQANFTVLATDPFADNAGPLGEIPIVGTMYDGRWFPLDHPVAGVTNQAPKPTVAVKRSATMSHHDECTCLIAQHVAYWAARVA